MRISRLSPHAGEAEGIGCQDSIYAHGDRLAPLGGVACGAGENLVPGVMEAAHAGRLNDAAVGELDWRRLSPAAA
jgi:hypothetical protein